MKRKRLSDIVSNKYRLEVLPTDNPDKFYLLKYYLKGGVVTVNQLICGEVFYRKWETYCKDSIKLIKGVSNET